jgi:hypothetical protein
VNNIGGWNSSGIQFRALRNSTITSLRFENQGAADTVQLTDGSGNVLATVSTPAGNTAYDFSPNWNLTAGQTYRILSVNPSNGRWVDFTSFPRSNTQIAVDGIFGNGGFHATWWFSFTNVRTCDR